jgi:polyvinyl alcohol dehydrogenase (cytochrome)
MNMHLSPGDRLKFGCMLALVVCAALFTSSPTIAQAVASHAAMVAAQTPAFPALSGADWPGDLYNPQNSSYNDLETTLTLANVNQLALAADFTVDTGTPYTDTISTSVLSVSGVLYFGSWNGYEYAVNAQTYQVLWKQFLGTDTPPSSQNCAPSTVGVASDGTIVNGILYVGGGDGNMYALDTTNGGAILWKTQVATPPNEFLWGDPAIGNGHVYIGIASFGDCPLIHGRVDMLDQATGAILAIHQTTTNHYVGNSVWSKIALDPMTGTVIYDTGNGSTQDLENDAIVLLDWNTLAVEPNGIFQIPLADQVTGDSDFGASCMVVSDVGGGKRGVICHNKNTKLYALTLGPSSGSRLAWSLQLGTPSGGESPDFDQADITSGTYDGRYAYFATTKTTLNGVTYPAAIYCIDPITGTAVWETPLTQGFSFTASAGANGVLYEALSTSSTPTKPGLLMALSMQTGAILFTYPLSTAIYGSPSVANGHVYVGTVDGRVYDFTLAGAMPTGDAFTGSTLGTQWSWINHDGTYEQLTGTALAITAQGQYQIQSKNFLTEPLPSGDFVVTTEVAFNPTSVREEAAMEVYQNGQNYVKIDLINSSTGVDKFEFKATVANVTQTITIADPFSLTAPVYLQIVRVGGTYYGAVSSDGANWLSIGAFTPAITPTVVGIGAYNVNTGPVQTADFYYCDLTQLV